MAKRPKLDLRAIIGEELLPTIAAGTDQVAETSTAAPNAPTPIRALADRRIGTLKQRARQQSLYLEQPLYDALREIAFTERNSMHALFLEGIDAVLKKRGLPSIAHLLGKAA